MEREHLFKAFILFSFCFIYRSLKSKSKWNMQYWLTEWETKNQWNKKKKKIRILLAMCIRSQKLSTILHWIFQKTSLNSKWIKNVNISNTNYVRHSVLWLLLLIVPLLSSFLYCTLNYLSLMIFSDSIKTRENWTKRQLPSMRWVRTACAKRSIHKWNLCTELFCGSAQLHHPKAWI